MFGQPTETHPCTCEEIELGTTLALQIKRSVVDQNGLPNGNDCKSCFDIISSSLYHLNCSNIQSVNLEFYSFPDCFKKGLFQFQKKNEFGVYENVGTKFNFNNPSNLTLPWNTTQNSVQPNGQFWRMCPDSCIDCSEARNSIVLKYHYNIISNGQVVPCNTLAYTAFFDDEVSLVSDVLGSNNFTLNPIPFNQKLILNNYLLQKYDIEILNMQGNALYKKSISNFGDELILDKLINGSYLLNIIYDNKVVKTIKIIKN